MALASQIGRYVVGECLLDKLPAVLSKKIIGSNEATISMALNEFLLDLFEITKAISLSERSVARN